jgi:hypothetical protein
MDADILTVSNVDVDILTVGNMNVEDKPDFFSVFRMYSTSQMTGKINLNEKLHRYLTSLASTPGQKIFFFFWSRFYETVSAENCK